MAYKIKYKISLVFILIYLFSIKISAQTSSPGAGMTDIDGNFYPTIVLGNQEWCSVNLKTTKFRNGDLIPYVSLDAVWANTTTPAKCIYNNDSLLNFNVFGYMYNFYAVEDPRNLCPLGWHVPSDYEWTKLSNYLGGLPVAGGKMKSLSVWVAPNTGATNTVGFSALPGGLRDYPGNFSSIYALGNWWSSTPRQMVGYVDGWYRDIWYNNAQLERLSYSKKDGFSVRCIKDSICVIDTTVYLNIPQNINACGDSVKLDAGAGYTTYAWSTGESLQSIYAKASGWYKVTVTNGVCSATDSVYVSLVKAKITASKTRICKGETITLQADTTVGSLLACAKTDLPSNLQTGLVAYYPFCGNANDASGNGNNGTVNGATLTTDRHGLPTSAYDFNGTNNYIKMLSPGPLGSSSRSISVWAKLDSFNGSSCMVSYGLYTGAGNVFEFSIGDNGICKGMLIDASGANALKSFPTNFNPHTWHLYTVVFNNSVSNNISQIQYYTDGNLLSSFCYNGSIGVNTLNNEPIYIGKLTAFNGRFFNGKIDDVGIWNRALTAPEVQQLYNSGKPTYAWSNGSTSNAISVTPTTTTKYYLTVNNGISSCIDSVTIVVDTLKAPTLPDNLNACGDSVLLNPNSNGNYTWNTGETSATIYAKATGLYKVAITNGVCSATDSLYVSLVKAKITASKTRICKGETIILQADTTIGSLAACAKTDLPSNLQTGLVAYYPFCGNANDASGNGNNGTVNGATLTADRFGRPNSAYSFNGVNNFISVENNNSLNPDLITVALWAKLDLTALWNSPNNSRWLLTKGCENPLGSHNNWSYRVYFWDIYWTVDNVNKNLNRSAISANGYLNYNWQHIVMTYDSVNTNFYINGQFYASWPQNSELAKSLGQLIFGARKTGSSCNLSNFYAGILDDISIWNRALSASEIQQLYTAQTQTYSWTSNAGAQVLGTDSVLNVAPTATTKYYLTVNNGISSCVDSVTIVVDSLPVPNLQDTLKVCGDSVLLNPGNFSKYAWSNGDTTATLTAKASGIYKVTVSNAAGCTATDSVYVSLVNAKITASKTRICKGETVTLQADTTIGSLAACAKSDLPSNLQNGLVAYYPFCGNANDASGNGYHGNLVGLTLTKDRNNRSNGAYYFDGQIMSGVFVNSTQTIVDGNRSYGFWLKFNWPSTFAYNHILTAQFGTSNAYWMQILGNGYGSNNGKLFLYNSITANRALDDNLWHHVVFTIDKINSTAKIYIDGVLNVSATIPSSQLAWYGPNSIFSVGNVVNPPGFTDSPFKGYIDEVCIWNRSLTASEVQQHFSTSAPQAQTYAWNTGATSNAISVKPNVTTKYYLTVNNGTSSCIDSVTILVDSLPVPNLQDTLKVCGDSVLLNPGSFSKYAWSNGDTTATLTAKASGLYKVVVTNAAGCSATDSVYVSLVKAKITASKTRICKGETVTLQADTTVGSLLACAKTDLPSNLQTGLVAYYPFCGNANDASGNGNNGTVNGATLTTDRFGKANSAYSFNGLNSKIEIQNFGQNPQNFTVNLWYNPEVNGMAGTNEFLHRCQSTNRLNYIWNLSWGFQSNQNYLHSILVTNSGPIVNQSGNNLPLNIWQLATMTFDGTYKKIYINGVVVDSVSLIGQILDYSNKTSIFLGYDSQTDFFKGKLDDIGIWNRALTAAEIQQYYSSNASQTQTYAWNTGAISNVISVTPTITTKYYLTVNNGISSCIDSVTIVVDTLKAPTLPDNLNACGDSVLLNPNSNGKYLWNTNDTTASIYAKATGLYKVTITNGVCSATDSVYVSLVKAKITASKTRICKGETITLQADTTVGSLLACAKTDLPSNLQTGLVAYYPFCGNANDASGNGHDGSIFGGVLPTRDRFGKLNSAYDFNGIDGFVSIANSTNMNYPSEFTISLWVNYTDDNSDHGIFTKHQTPIQNGFIVGAYNNKLRLWTNGTNMFSPLSYNDGNWHHVVFLYNGSSVKFYIDNNLVLTQSVTYNSNNYPVNIGKVNGCCFYKGKVDDIVMYNRAISLSEIQQLFTAQTQTYSWTSNAGTQVLGTDSVLNVNPTTNTKYYLTVNNGTSSCVDSVTILVDELPIPAIPKNIKHCGDSIRIIPDTNFVSYAWNTGRSSKTIYADTSGWYKLKVTDANGCINKDSALVSVVKSKIIAPITSTCYGSPLFLYADTLAKKSKIYPSNISWLPNNETISKIKLTGLVGGYNKLLVSDGIQTCRDSVLITVNALPIPQVPKNINHCGDSIKIILDTNFVSYVWNTGRSSKTIYADTSGWYKLTVTDANGCINKDSSLVSVVKAGINADTVTLCKGNHVNLKAIYKNLQSKIYPDQLLWSTTEQTPVIQVSPIINSTYTLTISNAIGGVCSTQVALTVNNLTTDLFGKDTLYVCNDSAIVTALNGLHNFVWNPLTSTTQQLVVKQTGWVYLTAQNANNCISSDSIFVYFTNTNFQLSDTLVCSGAGIITAIPVEKGGVFSGAHVINNQFTVPSKGGLYNITYSINNGTCIKTTTKWIRVIQRKDPNFVASINKLCRADGPVQFTFTEPTGLFYKDNLLFNSNQFLADKVGKYIFKYEVQSEKCVDSATQTIEVIERPNPNFNPTKLIACVGDIPIQLNPEENGGTFIGQYVKQNTFDPQKSGSYPILYKINNQQCRDSASRTIKVYDNPVGSISYTPPMPFMNDTVSFTFNGSKVSQYIWEFGNAASPETSKSANPKIVYLGFGIQNVSVTVTDSVGCSAAFSRNVNVQNRSTLFVPNAFTPTSDGNNEYFLAVGDGIISYKMIIFNRWGELLFESNDINKGWDGKFQGVLCPSGVYTYFIDAAGSDNRAYQFNGTVTLIR